MRPCWPDVGSADSVHHVGGWTSSESTIVRVTRQLPLIGQGEEPVTFTWMMAAALTHTAIIIIDHGLAGV